VTKFSGTFKVNSILCVGQGTRAINLGLSKRVGRYALVKPTFCLCVVDDSCLVEQLLEKVY